jgi:hypothetical protein
MIDTMVSPGRLSLFVWLVVGANLFSADLF